MTITLSEVTAWAAAGESDTVDLKRITGERRAATQSTLSAATKAGLPRVRVEVLPVVVQVAEEPEGGGLAPSTSPARWSTSVWHEQHVNRSLRRNHGERPSAQEVRLR